MFDSKVSIIIRTKNRLLFLKRAIEDIQNQTFQNWEAVVVNDGGDVQEIEAFWNDDKEILAKFALIHNFKESIGRFTPANVGIKACKGEYIVIHDDDDSWEPDFLKKCVEALDNSDYMGVVAYSRKVYEKIEGDTIKFLYTEPYTQDFSCVSLYKMAIKNTFAPISFVYRKQAHDLIGYYNENLPVLGDWEFNLRFLQKFDIDVIPETLANYHLRVNCNTQEFSNTIFGEGQSLHARYNVIIRNKLLREDIDNNKQGIGYLANIAPYMSNFGVNQEQNKQKHYDYSINREAIRANLEKLSHEYAQCDVYLYGAGVFLENALKEFDFSNINIKGVFDKNPCKAKINEYPVLNSEDMSRFKVDVLVATVINPCVIEDYIRKHYNGE